MKLEGSGARGTRSLVTLRASVNAPSRARAVNYIFHLLARPDFVTG